MHYVDCQVAIAGDIRNKAVITNASVAELAVLRAIHGAGSVTDIRLVGSGQVIHADERDRLAYKYPKHQDIVSGIFRDGGGNFPSDIRELKLPNAAFAAAPVDPHDQIDAMEGHGAESGGSPSPEDDAAARLAAADGDYEDDDDA